jgi:hypothetical protein
MKKHLFSIVLVLLCLTAKGDYMGYFLHFTITDVAGRTFDGYQFSAKEYVHDDSLKYPRYLLRLLDRRDHQTDHKIVFYKSLVQYDYLSSKGGQEKAFLLLEPISLDYIMVRSIQYLDKKGHSYSSRIKTTHQAEDVLWMSAPVLKSVTFIVDQCLWQINFHEQNQALEELHSEIEIWQQGTKEKLKELHYDYEVALPEHKENFARSLEDFDAKIALQTLDYLEQLEGFKLVIIENCAC